MNYHKISYGSEAHRKILKGIQARWHLSRNKMSDRYSAWKKMEEQALLYVKTSDADAKREALRDSGEPKFTTINVPYSYAQMLAMHTYLTSVFLGRTPVHQFLGRHSFSAQSEKAVEALIDYQASRMMVQYYIWIYDALKYGLGVLGTYWDEERMVVSSIEERPKTWMGVSIPGTVQKVKVSKEVKGYVGNKAYNVRPQDFFPDPRVPLSQFQSGEFVGRYVEVGYNYLRVRESNGYYFNISEALRTRPKAFDRERGSSQINLPNSDSTDGAIAGSDPVSRLDHYELLEMYIELVPSEWGLGSGTYPEKWCFTVVNDSVIIGAWPLGLNHNKYPFDILEYEIEGYGLFKRSMLEVLQPLNDTLSWLFNTHFYNVRKVLNDQLLVDPSRVTTKDILNSAEARIIRLKPAGYGQDPRGMIHQLAVADVTQGHITQDARVVMDLMNRVGRVSDNLMGVLAAGGRKSATEVRSANQSALSGAKTVAEVFSAMGWAPHAVKLLQSTQQFYDEEQTFRIAGALMNDAQAFMMVTPDLIAGAYDFVPVDGALPVDRQAQAYLWAELMQRMTAFPQVTMEFDIAKIFAHAAHLAGVKDVNQFRINVMDDAALRRAAELGNVIPLGGQGGQNRAARPTAVASEGEAPVGGAPQLTGVGPLA